jgi:hypothetical protein
MMDILLENVPGMVPKSLSPRAVLDELDPADLFAAIHEPGMD